MRHNYSIKVTRLLITPIKGLRVTTCSEVTLDRAGVRENRRFYLVDERGTMVNGKQLGELSQLISSWQEADGTLTVILPDGRAVSGTVSTGAEIEARFFRSRLRAPLVLGPWSEAISAHVGRPLRLVAADLERRGVDRGIQGTVSLVSHGSLERLAEVARSSDDVDSRRFRMLVEVDGVAPHGEDAWVGRRVRIGAALVGFNGHVGRCLVTNRDPDSGVIDFPTLDLLREYRGEEKSTEPLPFGIYGEVLEPGAVRVGDLVSLGEGQYPSPSAKTRLGS